MRVLVEGSGGSAGWPQPGCRCASCLRQIADGNVRMRSTIVIDGQVRLGVGNRGPTDRGPGIRTRGYGDAAGYRGAAGYRDALATR